MSARGVKGTLERGAAALLGCALLLGAGAPEAQARAVYRDGFGREKPGRSFVGGLAGEGTGGSGWHALEPVDGAVAQPFQGVVVDLRKAGVNRSKKTGSLSLWIQRGEQAGVEAVFSFTDAHYAPLAYAQILWDGWKERTETLLSIWSYARYPLWYWPVKITGPPTVIRHDPTFPLSKRIARGAWFNLVLTWGPTAGDNAIYVDGQKIKALTEKKIAMDDLVQDARYLVLGAQPNVDPWATHGKPVPETVAIPKAYNPMASTIAGVELHDTVTHDFPARFVDPDALALAAVEHDAPLKAGFSGKLVAGNRLDVTLRGSPGATASFDVAHFPDLERRIVLDWSGWGVYLEDKAFFEPGEVDLHNVEAYRVYAGTSPIDPVAPAAEPLARLDVQVQSYTVTDLAIDTPYYVAVLAEMRDGTLKTVLASPTGRALTESAPGVYTGVWEASWMDRYPRAVLVGHLAAGGAAVALAGEVRSAFAVDPTLTIAVATEPQELKADEKSTANVSVTVTDANGNPVPGHTLRFLLATTSQYTGVVGGGAFTEQVGGSLKGSLSGQTDLFGKVAMTYVAGFAAKTAVIVARDMLANSTGAGVVKTYIQAAAELELLPVAPMAMAATGYEITVSSSNEWLTADGKSQARITAKVTLGGKPVEGHEVGFAVSAGTGSIRVVRGSTGRDGEARALYTAGKKIGLVLVTATDTTVGISGSVQIELRSDAPAKIAIKLDPEKIPADGRSRAELTVLVTDINDNPNDNTEVEYRLGGGGGQLKEDKGLTDRRGESTNTYVAGRAPGRVTIEITVRSTVPSPEELAKAQALALAPADPRFF